MTEGVSTEELLKLLAGEVSVESFAAAHQMTVERARSLRDLGLSRIEGSRVRRWRGAALAALFVLVPGAALAQLVSFQADEPAVATQINGNFTQLKTWIEQKAGGVADAGIQTTTLNATGIVATSVNTGSVTAGSLSVSTNATITGNATVGGTQTITGVLTAGVVNATTVNASTSANLTNAVINGVNIRVKGGNNGTLNCDTYCAGNFNGFQGACVGIRLPSGGFSNDCSYLPGLLPSGGVLTCLCATF